MSKQNKNTDTNTSNTVNKLSNNKESKDIKDNKDIEIIVKANSDMLDYFNKLYVEYLETIQSLKTELFEVNVKLEELSKTKNVYVFGNNSRKNVFSPIINGTIENDKEISINSQINDLSSVKSSLEYKISEYESQIAFVKSKLHILNAAMTSIQNINNSFVSTKAEIEVTKAESKSKDILLENLEKSKSFSDISQHGNQILTLDAFDKTYTATLIDKKIKDSILTNSHKLEVLSYLISSDPEKAKDVLSEIINNNDDITDDIEDILNSLNYYFDTTKPIWMLLDNFVLEKREIHPECVIETDIKCRDYEHNISFVKSISLINLLNICFDNIFKHSNANHVILNITITEETVSVYINDNGVGISEDYYEKSTWYSGLHKAHEIIYLLNGNMNISGDYLHGTTIEFSYSVK